MFVRFVASLLKLGIFGGLLWFLLQAASEARSVGIYLCILTLLVGGVVLLLVMLGLWAVVDAVKLALLGIAEEASYTRSTQPSGPPWDYIGPPPGWPGDEPSK